MDELEQLERERKRLLGIRAEEQEKQVKKRKIKVLRREVKAMKRPKIIRVIKGVTKDSFSGVGMIFKAGAKKASPYVKQGLSNLAENSRREMGGRDPVPRRVKRKKVKKKVVKRRVIKRRKREESGFPFF